MPLISRIKVGDNYGNLTVVKKNDDTIGWICQCTCGNVTSVRTENLKKDSKCKKCFRKKGIQHYRWNGYKEISGTFFAKIKKRAKEDSINFNMTIEQLWGKYINQSKKCALSGVSILFSDNASIDRIDSGAGYIFNNIQIVDKIVNRMKWTMSVPVFVKLCSDCVEKPEDTLRYVPSNMCKHNRWRGCGDLGGDYFNSIKRKAEKRKLEFDVTIEQLWEKFTTQNYKCSITNRTLNFNSDITLQSASLDRIDNNIGYIITNVQWVYKLVNISRGALCENEYLNWCKRIWKQQRTQLET